jgi:hypothetical protein
MIQHRLFPVGLFTVGYMLAAVAAAIAVRNREFIFYIAVMVVLIAAVVAVDRRVRVSPGLLWGLSIWGALHMAGGLVPVPESWPTDGGFRVLYSLWLVPGSSEAGAVGGWLKYDQAVHTYGFGMATWLCWQGLCGAVEDRVGSADEEGAADRAGRRLRPTPGLMLLVAAAGMGLGALNEVIEFTATRFAETNVGGYENTGWDLVFNLAGCVGAALLILMSAPREGGG